MMTSTISQSDMQVSSEDFEGNTESKLSTAVCSTGVSLPVTSDSISERSRLCRMKLWSVHFRGFGPSVEVSEISELFGQAGEVAHIEICNHIYVGYGHVMYNELEQAKKAVELFDYSVYGGKLIRVYSIELDNMRQKELDIMRKKDVRCRRVIIKNINSSIDEVSLQDLCSMFGTVTSCKVYTEDLQSDGYRYGAVEFEKEGVAAELIRKLDGMLLDDQLVEVSPFDPEKEEDDKRERLRRTVVVSNLSEDFYELEKYFFQFGYVTRMRIERDGDGRSIGVGSVCYRTVEDADSAVKKMDGYMHDNKIWSVKKFPMNFEQEKSKKSEHLQYGYIQVKNLHGFVSDEPLREMFSEFGPISFCKVMLDSQGQSIGTGLVIFSTPADATRAVIAMNGKVIVGKPLSVALLEEKKSRLEVAKVYVIVMSS